MSDTPSTPPLHIVSCYMSPSAIRILSRVKIVGALLMVALVFILPMIMGELDKLITYVLLGFAALEFILALALPYWLGSRPSPQRFEFYEDHMDVALGATSSKPLARINYDEIDRVEELSNVPELDREAGFTSVAIYLNAARSEVMRLPYYGTLNGPALTIKGLRQEENPLARIKELVEKSKRS